MFNGRGVFAHSFLSIIIEHKERFRGEVLEAEAPALGDFWDLLLMNF